MHAEELAKTIDHTLLRADSTSEDVERLCAEAVHYHFAAVCIFPHFVPLAAERLRGADVKVACVISFPFGADSARVKTLAADDAVARGADEVDVVINVPAFLSGDFGLVGAARHGVVGGQRLDASRVGAEGKRDDAGHLDVGATQALAGERHEVREDADGGEVVVRRLRAEPLHIPVRGVGAQQRVIDGLGEFLGVHASASGRQKVGGRSLGEYTKQGPGARFRNGPRAGARCSGRRGASACAP